MRVSFIEVAAIAFLLLSLVQRITWSSSATATWSLLGLSFGLMLIAFAVNPMRWQLLPSVIVLLIVLVQALAALRSEPGNGLGGWSSFSCVALLAVSAGLIWGFPAGGLSAPLGPFKVGVVTSELTRPPSSDGPARDLIIKIWYPADAVTGPRTYELLWSDLQSLKEVPAIARAPLAYMNRIKTHSLVKAPLAVVGKPYPLLIYNHSLLSFASENTLLMEWLASNGYVVLSIRHQDQAAEYAAIQKGISKAEQARDRELSAQLGKATSREERGRLSMQMYENSTGMSEIVRRRAGDSEYVLNNFDAVLTSIPGATSASVDAAAPFGALGLSLGGAVATRLCLSDMRCAGAANLDGGLYGLDDAHSLPSRYLMIYSADNPGSNDAFNPATEGGYAELVLPNAKHLDLHDASVVLPGLKWFGALGAGSGIDKNRRMKESVTGFFDGIMKTPVQ